MMRPGHRIRSLIERGDHLLEQGALDEAEGHYREALAIDPDSAEALYSIGCVASHRREFESSLDWAHRALAVDAGHVGATELAGNAFLGLERYAEALPYLKAADAVAPSVVTTVQIALSHEGLGDLEEAENGLRAVLEKDPAYITRHLPIASYSHAGWRPSGSADVHAHLARVLQRLGKLEEARLHYHLAKRIDPLVELDPMYLDVMRKEELEDHPIDALMSERWADDLDLSALGEAAEPARSVLRLARSPTASELENAARGADADALLPVAGQLIWGAQTAGRFGPAAVLRVVGDCLQGDDVSELFPAVKSPSWQRLFEIAELLHNADWTERDALAAATREGRPVAPELLVALVDRFVTAHAPSGLVLARVADATLREGVGGGAALEATILVGRAWADTGDAAAAESVLAKAVMRADTSAETDLLLSALDGLGRAQGERGRSDQAVATFERLVAEADRVGDLEAARRGRHNLAVALGRSGRAQAAYETAIELAAALRVAPHDERWSQVGDLVRWTASQAGAEPSPDLLAELPHAPEGSIEDLRRRAAQLAEAGRTEEVLSALDEARETARARGVPASEGARALYERASVLRTLGRTDEAQADLDEAIETLAPGDSRYLVAAYHDIAAIHHAAGRTDQAVQALEHAIGHARRLRSPEDEAALRERLAMLLRDNDPELATYHFGKAVHLRSPPESHGGVLAQFVLLADVAAEDPDGVLRRMTAELADLEAPPARRDAALITGMAALDADRPDLAEQPLIEALTLAVSDDWRDAERELAARQALGTAYRRTGRSWDAIDQYRRALSLAERLRDEIEAAELRGRLAIALRYTDQLDAAVEEYRHALGTLRRYDLEHEVAVNQMNLASALFVLGRTEEATDTALEALAIFDDEGESALALRTLALLAGSAAAKDLPSELIDRLRSEASHSRDEVLLAWSATDRGHHLLDQGDIPGADQQLKHAIEIHRSRGDRFNEAMSHLNRARLLAPVDATAARSSAEAALQIGVEIGQRHLASNAEIELLQLAVIEGDDDEIDRLLDSLVAAWTERRRALQHDRDRIALADETTPLLKLCADHYLAEGRLQRAFEVLDLGRAQGLTDALAIRREPQERMGELLPRVRVLLDLLPQPTVALTLDLIGARIVLGIFRADFATPRFADTGVTDADLTRLLESFRSEMLVYRGHGPQTWAPEAQRLLAPARSEINEGDLVILLLDGELQLLPLHTVGLPPGTSVFYAPSFAALELSCQLPRSDDEPLSRVVTVGVAFPDEARAIGIGFGGLVLSGRTLDKDEVRERVSDATIVHFACHGFFDTEDFLDSGLLLRITETPSRVDVLALRDLLDWQLHADLVVLSACETGLGKVVPSDFLGLGRGILAAGARAVMVTLWPVEDAATQVLMLDVYREMARQRDATHTIDVALALSAAQRRLAETRPLYDWAAFKLIGWPKVEWGPAA